MRLIFDLSRLYSARFAWISKGLQRTFHQLSHSRTAPTVAFPGVTTNASATSIWPIWDSVTMTTRRGRRTPPKNRPRKRTKTRSTRRSSRRKRSDALRRTTRRRRRMRLKRWALSKCLKRISINFLWLLSDERIQTVCERVQQHVRGGWPVQAGDRKARQRRKAARVKSGFGLFPRSF